MTAALAAHKGNDVIGDRLQPLLAMRDGVVDRLLDHPTAGFGIVIRDADGWEYHLYHANNDTPTTDDGADDGSWRFAPGIVPGRRRAGRPAGRRGWVTRATPSSRCPTPTSRSTAPTAVPINPYWSLRRAQRDVNCGSSLVEAGSDGRSPTRRGWSPAGASTALPARTGSRWR